MAVKKRNVNDSDPKHIAAQALQALQLRRQLERGEVTHEEYLNALDLLASPSAPVPPPLAAVETKTDPVEVKPRPLMSALELLQLRRRLDNGELAPQEYHAQLETGVAQTIPAPSMKAEVLEREEDTVTEELARLQAESAKLIRVKRAAGILGWLCGLLFAYEGIAGMGAQRAALATSLLFSGSALLGIIVCITLHTSKVRAQLTMRIRELRPSTDAL